MANEKHWKGGRLGPFHLGRRYKDMKAALGADAGRLYEAHNVHTGASALVLVPSLGVDWTSEERWQVRASSQVSPPYLALEVEQAPPSGHLPALAEMLDLLSSELKRMEHSAEARAHLTHLPTGWLARWTGHVYRWSRSRPRLSLGGMVTVGFVLGLWLSWPEAPQAPVHQRVPIQGVAAEALEEKQTPFLVGTAQPEVPGIAYPMPDKPFPDQAKAPCRHELDEETINGGCWMELARRPPCLREVQAEYKGKCYVPVTATRKKAPHSLQP